MHIFVFSRLKSIRFTTLFWILCRLNFQRLFQPLFSPNVDDVESWGIISNLGKHVGTSDYNFQNNPMKTVSVALLRLQISNMADVTSSNTSITKNSNTLVKNFRESILVSLVEISRAVSPYESAQTYKQTHTYTQTRRQTTLGILYQNDHITFSQ